MGIISRFLERHRIVADTDEHGDPDEYIPVPPRIDKFVPAALAARVASGEEPCPHFAEEPLLPSADGRDKLFRCGDCGLVYRHQLVAGKPWLIAGYVPVGAQR